MDAHRHHPETGEVIIEEPEDPAAVEARAITKSAEVDAKARVEIARVEADTAVELAKIERSALAEEERIELEALREEVRTLRDLVSPPEPEPIPVPVPTDVVEDEVVEDAPPEVDGSPAPPAARKTIGLGAW
jgi:hypothetical protein